MCSERDASTDRRTVDFGKAKKGSRNSTCAAPLTMNFIRSMRFHGVGPSSDPQRVAKKTIAKKGPSPSSIYTIYTSNSCFWCRMFAVVHHDSSLYHALWHHMTPQPDSNLPTWRRSLLLFLHGMPITLWWLKSLVNWLMACPNQLSVGCGALAFHPQTNAKDVHHGRWHMITVVSEKVVASRHGRMASVLGCNPMSFPTKSMGTNKAVLWLVQHT